MVNMTPNHNSHMFISSVLLVVLLRSGVKGQLCPPGQVTHIDGSVTRCCLPADCAPRHYLKYCERNGTFDTCQECPLNFGLFKRTSSFAVEPCHQVHSDPGNQCQVPPEAPDAYQEDMKNCLCNLEDGNHYLKPQIPLGPSSYCQPFNAGCSAGHQPNQDGQCEPCARNTVQDKDHVFTLCRPQRNCTAMRLKTERRGNAARETVCESLPPPSNPPAGITTTSHKIIPVSSPKPASPILPGDDDVSVQPSSNLPADDDAPWMIILAVLCTLALVCIVFLFIIGRRRGWCVRFGKCQGQDVETHVYPGSQMQMSGQDNDNTSDNSCCACADNCLPSANKSSNNIAGKPGSSVCDLSQAGSPKLAMLEGYTNGKCTQSSPCESLSEPLYNSINSEKSTMSDDSMPVYKNVNNYLPPRSDLYSYPNKVDLPPSKERQSTEKLQDNHSQQGALGGRERKERENFAETDPLLPNLETCSSGVPTPILKGILRNGNNRQEQPRGTLDTQGTKAREDNSLGNRPDLSFLLNLTDISSQADSVHSQVENIPHLSQLISAQHSSQGLGSQESAPLQHQQLQQQAAPQQPSARPSPQFQRTKQRQQGSPQAARLVPVTSALPPQRQPNPTIVRMEELKPVMPLSPNVAEHVVPVAPAGAAECRDRSASPARINPSQHKELRGNDSYGLGRESPSQAAKATSVSQDHDTITKKTSGEEPAVKWAEKDTAVEGSHETTAGKELGEETFRKEEIPAASPDGDETMQKSVGGSSGLGDSLDVSSALDLPSEDESRSRTKYRRSNSEASRSVSPSLPLPASRSISTPDDRRPFAVVKPMQSDQSLNAISGSQAELTQPLDVVGRHFPLDSLGNQTPGRQSSQESADDLDQTLPKTPDRLSEDEDDSNESDVRESEERTGPRVGDSPGSVNTGGRSKDTGRDRASED